MGSSEGEIVKCNACGQKNRVRSAKSGAVAICRNCKAKLRVSSSSASRGKSPSRETDKLMERGYVGLWDRFFGKKNIINLPGESGEMISKVVTNRWLAEMDSRGTMKAKSHFVVHVIEAEPEESSRSSRTSPQKPKYDQETWKVGPQLSREQVLHYLDPASGSLYATRRMGKENKKETVLLTRDKYEELKNNLEGPGGV